MSSEATRALITGADVGVGSAAHFWCVGDMIAASDGAAAPHGFYLVTLSAPRLASPLWAFCAFLVRKLLIRPQGETVAGSRVERGLAEPFLSCSYPISRAHPR